MNSTDSVKPVSIQIQGSREFISDFTGLWEILLRGRIASFSVLISMMIGTALLEMAALASVLPLVGSLIDSQTNDSSSVIQSLPLIGSLVKEGLSQSALLGGIVVLVVVSAVFRIEVIRRNARFSALVAIDLQRLYVERLLHTEYEKIINQSSSDNVSLVTNKIQLIIRNYILSVLSTVTSVISAIGVLTVLVLVSNSVVFIALAVLATAYLIVAWFTRVKLKRYARSLNRDYPRQIRQLREGLGGIRDVIMSGSQKAHVQQFSDTTAKVEIANAQMIFYNQFPKPLLEAVAICSVAAIAWLVHKDFLPNENLLPMLGAFALGTLRLLPYMQQIFLQWTRLIHGRPMLAELMSTLKEKNCTGMSSPNTSENSRLGFSDSIVLENVGFCYQGTSAPVFRNINVCIRKGEYIGIVGETGSGKSTLVDILMGLLKPGEGRLLVDGTPIDESNRRLWRHNVAHVPQRIFLSQSSIARNIAYSVPEALIDMDRVRHCASLAHIDDFIRTLPFNYETSVGEDGVRLSGGQRQRIGIARALYARCEVLILDEATNALDQATESAIVSELLVLERRYTIVSVAHNLQAVRHCHRKLQMSKGRLSWAE